MSRTVQARLERIVQATAAKLAEKRTISREYNTELEQVRRISPDLLSL